MYNKGELIRGILIGVLSAVAIFCLVVAIGCAINGVSFGEQIVNWFGSSTPSVEGITEEVLENVPTTPVV